jgi:hypothetical protein
MNSRVVVVLDEDSYSTTIEPLLIISLERSEKGKGGNGSAKTRPA